MESINKALGNVTKRQDFKARYEKEKRQVLQDPDVREFIKEHTPYITQELIDRNLIKLYEFVSQSKRCESCQSLSDCKNLIKGYYPSLLFDGKNIDLLYDICPSKQKDDELRKHRSLIKSIYVPKEILDVKLTDIEIDEPSRFDIIRHIQELVKKYGDEDQPKALFIHGSFGVGKTYILGAIANELADIDVSSMLVYVPEFLREMKNSINDQSIDKKLDAVKKVPVLMLDDIGAESMSSWIRDEVLGTILQHRMLENLPTFFTSNFNFDQLLHHLTYSQRGEAEEVKARRILERIKYLAKPVELKGQNRRA
ncbi:primosomal protein DnaI [Metabacillus arenae]|uniref:Primosomal protein DnaI n=1 Tax=Metabacillus arenae TaxID=2771434 RepID=A0A926NLM6_9BACI|nr:primosomal protein DnaI [Metabacillus arenae]MBD1380076.1 primosomal protein DnaI [Metabacillus arenae]